MRVPKSITKALIRILPYPTYLWIKRNYFWITGGFKPVHVENGLSFVVYDPNDRKAIKAGAYEHEELKWALEHVRSGMNVIEVGGGMGVVSCFLALQVGESGRLVVVEPLEEHRHYIQGNIRRNNLESRTVVLGYGLGYSPYLEMSYGRGLSNSLYDYDAHRRRVPCKSLKEIIDTSGIRPDVLIIDAEGAESELFLREKDLLAANHTTVIAEVHPGLLNRTAEEIVGPLLEDFSIDVKMNHDGQAGVAVCIPKR